MNAFVGRTARRAVLVALLVAAATGVAYAAIPDGGGAYTACMLNKVGTVRLIDPSLPASNLMSHCTGVETKFAFNQQGQQGSPGLPGAPGKDGAPGANGKDGADGKDAQPFSGTFTSPNGQFSITVDDSGIKLAGPSNSIELSPDGAIDTVAGTSFNLTAGGATNLVSGTSLNLKSGAATRLEAGGSLNAKSAGATSLDVGGPLTLQTAAAATLSIGTSLTASIGGPANVAADSLDLKATGIAILEAGGLLKLTGAPIKEN